jgi:hypothetical protein
MPRTDIPRELRCIFDYTVLGAVIADALTEKSRLLENQRATR